MRPPSRTALLLACAATVGCGEDQRSAKPTTSASATASAAPSGPLTLNGQTVPVTTWLAFSRGGRAVQIIASTHPILCEDLTAAGIKRESGELTVDLTIAPLLDAKGEETWRVARARLGQVTRRGKFGAAELTESDDKRPDLAKPITVDATIPFPVPGQSLQKLELKGELKPTSCGTKPLLETPTVLPQNDLEVKLAGRKVVMRGASYVASKNQLHVSTQPHGCPSRAGSDILLTMDLDPEKKTVRRLRVDGFALPRLVGGTVEGLSAEPREDAPDGRSAWSLEGDITLGGYPLKVDGTVQAEACP